MSETPVAVRAVIPAEGWRMDQLDAENLAAELLGVSSLDVLARAQLARLMLADGRVEAHEYGRNQHSSAAAGGVLIGLSGAYGVPDSVVVPLSRVVAALIDHEGRVRSHDGDPESGDSTWAQSQILLGLLTRPHLVDHDAKLAVLLDRLLSFQEAGGWPLRAGETPALTFTFYPVLALSRAIALGLRTDRVRTALHAAVRYLQRGLNEDRLGLEEQVLAHFALDRALVSSEEALSEALLRRRAALIDACWSADAGIRLKDQLITIYRQPVWHTITWRPLLYLCLRRWISPLSALGVLLGSELIDTFDRELVAWRGPAGAVSLGSGSSWASALAFRGVTAFAYDLVKTGSSATEFRARLGQVVTERYSYDVAISFAGADRAVAEVICQRLKAVGLRVFYDREFLKSRWAGNWELKAVLARMQQQQGAYVLPYVMEDVAVPGLSPTLGYVAAADYTVDEFADLVVRKFRDRLRGT